MNSQNEKQEAIETCLEDVCEQFKKGLFNEADQLLLDTLKIDYEHPLIQSALKYAGYWKLTLERLHALTSPLSKGEFLMAEWKKFLKFVSRMNTGYECGIFAIRYWAFHTALNNFLAVSNEQETKDSEITYKIGLCYKFIGDFEKSTAYLEEASSDKRDNAEILAQLADSYAFLNEVKLAKLIFREAFFIDPYNVKIDDLDSDLIVRLIENVKKEGFEEPYLLLWIPIYGVLTGVFNVRRELRTLEYGKLKQAIFQLESQLSDKEADKEYLIPRLINHYFWLIDHLTPSKDSYKQIDEILMKLKILSADIYERYIN